MALSSTRAIYNAAVDTCMAALETMIEAEPAAGRLAFVPVEGMKGDNADTTFGADTTAVFNGNGVRRYVTVGSISAEADIPLKLGTHPHFWKITNAAGDT